MNRFRITVFALLAGLSLGATAAEVRRIPVEDFFRHAEFKGATLSPTGEYITVSVPRDDRTLLAAFRVSDMKLIGKWDWGKDNHIDRVQWVNDERFFMYVSEKKGRFDRPHGRTDAYASNVDGTQRADILNGGIYQIVDRLEADEDKILVQRSVGSAFLSKMDVDNGEVTTVSSSPLYLGSFLLDHNNKLRYLRGMTEDREVVLMRREGRDWVEVSRSAETDVERMPLDFAADNEHVIYSVSIDGKPTKTMLVDPATGEEKLISKNTNVDPDGYLYSSDETELLAVSYEDGYPSYDFVKPDHPESKVYAGLINAFPNKAVAFRGISDDGRYMLFVVYSGIDPASYYLFDQNTGKAKFLLSSRNWIKPEEMAPMKPIYFTARDGTNIYGYLTVPRESDGKNLPMVLFLHGGPTARDIWGFNPDVQFLANRGYAVLQVNFRGSTGYGGDFTKQGNKNWGTVMIDDMTDAVDWAIHEGVADKDRICTYGASYGGYAALQSVVRNPNKYQCTIGYVGVYSLPLMFEDGDIRASDFGVGQLEMQMPETRAEQQAQSPAYNVDKIDIPVMLVVGKQDERVPFSQYEALNDALVKAGKPPEIVIIEDKEAHGFFKLENNIDLYNTMEKFLDKHIGSSEQKQASSTAAKSD